MSEIEIGSWYCSNLGILFASLSSSTRPCILLTSFSLPHKPLHSMQGRREWHTLNCALALKPLLSLSLYLSFCISSLLHLFTSYIFQTTTGPAAGQFELSSPCPPAGAQLRGRPPGHRRPPLGVHGAPFYRGVAPGLLVRHHLHPLAAVVPVEFLGGGSSARASPG